MVPIDKVKEIITRYDALEKELSSGNIDPKLFAKKSKEYSSLGSIIKIARDYVNFDNEKKDLLNMVEDKSNDQEIIHTVYLGLIHITDISFPRNRKGLLKPLKTLWKSTMGVHPSSTLARLV